MVLPCAWCRSSCTRISTIWYRCWSNWYSIAAPWFGARHQEKIAETNRLLVIDEDVPGGASAYILQQLLEEQDVFPLLDSAPSTPIHSSSTDQSYGSDVKTIFSSLPSTISLKKSMRYCAKQIPTVSQRFKWIRLWPLLHQFSQRCCCLTPLLLLFLNHRFGQLGNTLVIGRIEYFQSIGSLSRNTWNP